MGSWSETCAITQQSFYKGRAYCIIQPREFCFNIRAMFNLNKTKIALGYLDCYGGLFNIEDKTADADYSVQTYWDSNEKLAVNFCKESAWSGLIKYIRNNGIDFSSYADLKEEFSELNNRDYFPTAPEHPHKFLFEWFMIHRFLHKCRREFINNNTFSGSQYDNKKDLKFINSL